MVVYYKNHTNTLHVLQGQNAVIFNVKSSDTTELYRVKHENNHCWCDVV